MKDYPFPYFSCVEEKCSVNYPNSPIVSSQSDLPEFEAISLPPFRPEESFDSFESISHPMFQSSCFQDIVSFPSVSDGLLDPFESHEINQTDSSEGLACDDDLPFLSYLPKSSGRKEKKAPQEEVIKFVCVRSSCKRVYRKCGQLTSQRLRKFSQERYHDCFQLKGNCYYNFCVVCYQSELYLFNTRY